MSSPLDPSRIAELTNEMVCLTDLEGQLRWVNDRWSERLGWSKEELLSRSLFDLFHPEDLNDARLEFEALQEGRGPLRLVTRSRRKDGTWCHLDWTAVSTPEEVFIATARDVTETLVRERELAFKARLLRMAENMAQVGHWRVDVGCEAVYWSDQVYAIHGRIPGAYQPTLADAIQVYHPDDRPTIHRLVEQAIKDKSAFDYEGRIMRPDGELRTVHSKGQVLLGDDGQVASIFGVFQDITELRRRERDLQQLNEDINVRMAELTTRADELEQLSELADLLQSAETEAEVYDVLSLMLPQLFEPLDGAVYIVPSSKRTAVKSVEWGNPSQEAVIGISDCWALRRGRTHELHSDRGLVCAHHNTRPTGGSVCSVMMAQGESVGMLVLKAGGAHSALLRSKAKLAITVADQLALAVTNVRLRESLREQSIKDALTQLYNRRYMDEALERELARAIRRDTSVSVAMLDLDHFKRFNDDYGHLTADALLESFGGLLRKALRREDVACRWGGEEFLLLLPETDAEVAYDVLQRIHEGLAEIRVSTHGQPTRTVTASMGVASYPTHADKIERLIRLADQALYQAKQGGRDQTVIAPLTRSGLSEVS